MPEYNWAEQHFDMTLVPDSTTKWLSEVIIWLLALYPHCTQENAHIQYLHNVSVTVLEILSGYRRGVWDL